MLDAAALTTHADTFHTVAQTQWRQVDRADSTLVYLPEHGQPTIQVLIGGTPPATNDAARTARELGAVALILTAEAWGMFLPTEKAARLPTADRPRPIRIARTLRGDRDHRRSRRRADRPARNPDHPRRLRPNPGPQSTERPRTEP